MDSLVYRRVLPNGRLIAVMEMTFGKHRLTIGPVDCPVYDDGY